MDLHSADQASLKLEASFLFLSPERLFTGTGYFSVKTSLSKAKLVQNGERETVKTLPQSYHLGSAVEETLFPF